MHYQEKVDALFEKDLFPHRNLRTLFDHQSEEWKQTSFVEKEELLMKLYLSDQPISFYVRAYIQFVHEQHADIPADLSLLPQSIRQLIMHVKDELIRASLLKIYVDLSRESE